jgi:hypothetical protein
MQMRTGGLGCHTPAFVLVSANTRARLAAPKLVVAVGLALLFAAFALAGAQRSRHLQGTNHLRPNLAAAGIGPGQTVCQGAESIPAGTGGLRVRAAGGGAVTLSVDGAVTARLAAGWPAGDVVFDFRETRAVRDDARLCFANGGPGVLTLFGEAFPPDTAAKVGDAPQPGRAGVQYLRAGEDSWFGLASALADRVSGARDALPGGATPYLWALLALGVIGGAATLAVRGGSGRAVALLVTANALAWGLLVPPLQVPDEPSHAFYAQYLGETGKLPTPSGRLDWYSGDVTQALGATAFYYVIGQPDGRPSWEVHVKPDPDRVGTGNAATASSNPPLYYLAQAAVYRAGHGLGVLDRLALMRLLSAVLAGLTALCVFAFLRELLPGSPLASMTGALLAGLLPLFAFISSGVNNDAGLYLVSAALFLALARVLRRGLTARRAIAAGALLGCGVLVKTQVLAFAPAVLLAFVLARGPHRARVLGALAALFPLALYGLLGATVWSRPVVDRVDVLKAPAPRSGSLLSYAWQEYLPRLPLMDDLVPGVQPWSLWFKGLVGRFGWLDYGYPGWAYGLALLLVLATVAAAGPYAWSARHGRGREIAVFAVATVGLLGAVAAVSYRAAPPFDQARYLLPLLPLFALVPALAVRAAGHRRAPTVAALLIMLAIGLSGFAQLLTIARYYG